MSSTFFLEDVERFRRAIADRIGLSFEDAKVGFLEEVLRRRLGSTGRDCDSYLRLLEGARIPAELGALADELTVPETYFFRNIDQFRAFAERVVPERVKSRASLRELSVLSAGCASGEEPYTVAIILREILEPGWTASVLGVDLNPSALRKARSGRFSRWSLRETPPDAEQRWFKGDARDIVLDDSIRASVKFEQHNLVGDDPDLWGHQEYDVVFCRNVIMYLTTEGAINLVSRIARALAPNGFLFLGHAETLRGFSQDFELCHTHRTFYYQRKAENGRSVPNQTGAVAPADGSSTALIALVDGTDTWVDAIRAATDRVQQLVEYLPPPAATPGEHRAVPARSGWSLGRALELLRKEQFAEALGLVEALPSEAARDPDVLLLQAVLLTHSGLLLRAEETCRRLLEIDGLNAGSHYVLALCSEGMGDLEGAAGHDRMAAYLDPRFAMPRLHLGLLGRRAHDREGMRRELSHAITLLEHEDSSRLLLFGGGFTREALIALCRAEMLVNGDSR